MFTYAFKVLKQSNYEAVAAEEFENIQELFTVILTKGIAQQIKQGLYREYILKSENLSVMRGKININGTIHNKLAKRQELFCEYDELSENNIFNQILKTTAMILLRQSTINLKYKQELKKVIIYFNNVDMIDLSKIKWNMLKFQRSNQNYKMLMNICYFVLTGLLLSTEKGEYKMATFLDEQRMCRLYEKFVLEYYKYHHSELHPTSAQVDWLTDDGVVEFLPIMQTDIMLRHEGRILIIDTKYYSNMMQKRYESQTLHSSNLYQIFTYVKNKDVENTGNVSGMLLYAKTTEQIAPDCEFHMSGNKISVKTLDLNVDFKDIKTQLEEIIKTNF